APLGRTVMLSHLAEQVRLADGRRVNFGGREHTGDAPELSGAGYLTEFRLEAGLPVWRYDIDGTVIEKRLFMAHMQNTVHLVYELLSGADQVQLALRPSVNFRAQEGPVDTPLGSPYEIRAHNDRYEVWLDGSDLPPLRMTVSGGNASFTLKGMRLENILYPVEESRGYQARGVLWSPGLFKMTLPAGGRAALVASTESFETMAVLDTLAALDAERRRRQRLLAH